MFEAMIFIDKIVNFRVSHSEIKGARAPHVGVSEV